LYTIIDRLCSYTNFNFDIFVPDDGSPFAAKLEAMLLLKDLTARRVRMLCSFSFLLNQSLTRHTILFGNRLMYVLTKQNPSYTTLKKAITKLGPVIPSTTAAAQSSRRII